METQAATNKRIAKNTIALYIRMFLLLLIGLYTSRATLAIFGVEDFGIYNLVGGIISMTIFIRSAMILSVERFLAYAIGLNDKKHLEEVFSMSINIHILIAVLIVLLGETIGLWFINTQLIIPDEKMVVANIIYQASIISLVFNVIGTPYNSIVIAHEHMSFFSLVTVLQGVMKLLFVLALPYIQENRLSTYALLMTTPSLLFFVMNYVFCRQHFSECNYHYTWSKKLFCEMASFAGYSTFGNMATALVTQGQSILLNIFYGPALNAVRGLAMQVSVSINSFISGTYTAVNPQIIKSYAQKDYTYFHKLIFNATVLGYFILFLITLPVFLEIEFILNFWLKEVPEYTVIFVRLLLVNTLIYNFVIPSWMAIQATGKVMSIHLTTGTINLMNLLITYILWKIYHLEPYSIYVVNIVVSLCMQVATIILQRNLLDIKISNYLRMIVWPVLVASAGSIVLPLCIVESMESGIIRFLLVLSLSVCSTIVSFYLIGLNSELKEYIRITLIHKFQKLFPC
jgi:O-antigen/teichoic acid export membrane protein